jgi:flavorubredoxin
MALELYNNDEHACLMFHDLVKEGDDAVQSNQFLVVDHGHGALIDPGGNVTYNALVMALSRYFAPKNLECVLASHADPDIIASVNKWIVSTSSKVYISKLWERFVPHFLSIGTTKGRIVPIPDNGMRIRLGQCELLAVPAHFLHAEGNFQFYDPVARILFTGDLGASILPAGRPFAPVDDFDAHVSLMEGFHRRYMAAGRICKLWAHMVRELDLEWIVPQHGVPFRGRTMCSRFIEWVGDLDCGVDLMGPQHYQLP